ncbi:MAG TPA: response regulator [Phycisphaerales bacterium]|nr:response regulator [Phycisphaerales bacterium]
MKKALTIGLHIRHKARLHGRLTDVEFHSAGTQEEALEILEGDEHFNLLVVDESLENSEEFLQKIKPLKIPTIYCADSGKSSGFLRSLVVDLEVSVVLVKPVDPDEMVLKAGELLSAKRTVEERGDGVQQQMRARLAALWEKFGPTNRERLEWLKDQIADVLEGEEKDEAARREMEREAHKMVGALGTFGFPNATVLAREIELHVSPSKSMAPLDGNQLMKWAQAIDRELSQGPQGALPSSSKEEGTGVLVVSTNPQLVEQVGALEIEGVNLQVQSVSTWGRAREIWFLKAPDLVIVDLCGETANELQTLLQSVAAKLSTIPVLILLPKDVWNQPDALSRYAGFPVLFHPFEPSLLDTTVRKLLANNNRPKPKVLAVDDDPQILDALTVLLAPLKLDITTLSDPLEFWDTLERTGPDLLILDLDMPFLSGIELCRGVRSSPRWWELPVLFLSASSDEENLQRLFTVGADDFVPKPFHGPELATRVVNRLVRSTNQTTSDKADFKSGLDGLRSVLGEERWKDSAFVIALIKVWNDSTLVNEIGATTVSQLNRKLGVRLADRLRGIGTVARWRSNEFVVALPNQTLDAGTHLLQTLVTQEEVVNFDYGQDNQVEFRVVAGTTRMLHATDSLDAALRLCQQALKKVDGENVRVASEEMVESLIPAEAEKCQLLILEPDQATGQAVEKLLKDCGYQPLWEPKTDVAVARLTSEPPTLEAKAIFISSGGLNLLEQLGPVSKMVNVVVAVSSEKDLISAFESGAYDCIEKPCKVGTLLKRLERAVGA